jgi:hypothetical protein
MSAPPLNYEQIKSRLIAGGWATGVTSWLKPGTPVTPVMVACPNPKHPNSGRVVRFFERDGVAFLNCPRVECRDTEGSRAIREALDRAIEGKQRAWNDAQTRQRASAPVDDPYFDVECLDDVQSRPVQWEWPSRLLKGSLNLIVGIQGEGKSTALADLTARRTTGRPWPDGAPSGEPTNVLIFSAEEVPDYTIKPRCVAAGADTKRIFIVRGGMNLDTDLAKLGRTIRQKQIGLVIIDPLSSYLPKMNAWVETDVRRVLDPVSRFAQDATLTIIATMHLNKKTDLGVLDRVMGSVAFTAVPRSAILVAREAVGDRVLFDTIKHNYTPKPPVLAFTIVPETVMSDTTRQPMETSRIEWSEEAVETTGQDALDIRAKRGGSKPENGPRGYAKKLILSALSSGPFPAAEMEAMLDANNVTDRTADRAKSELRIGSWRLPPDGPWFWFPSDWEVDRAMEWLEKGGDSARLSWTSTRGARKQEPEGSKE